MSSLLGRTTNYSRENFVITVNGVPITGYADGDFFSAVKPDDEYTQTTGSHGEQVQNRKTTPGGTVESTINGGSTSNDYLQGLKTQQDLDGVSTVKIFAKDTYGGDTASTRDAKFTKSPDMTAGDGKGDVTWSFVCGHLLIIRGGQTT
jgi:hypothetical protein